MSAAAPWLLVALGGAAGSCARHAVGRVGQWIAPQAAFPWPTLAVNAVGCLLIGWWLPALRERGAAGEPWRLLLVVGLIGGFTTYSAFSAESYELARAGHTARAAAYVGATLVLGAAATAFGAWLHARLGGS